MYAPSEILVDTRSESKAVVLEPELGAALPGLVPAFEHVDEIYQENPLAHLRELGQSVFSFQQHKENVFCSLICNQQTAQSTEMLVIFSAFSDCAPLSTPEQIHAYVDNSDAGFIAKQKARPNTWNQTTKSSVTHDLLEALDMGMPVLTIYSPIPPRAYTAEERRLIRRGNLSPAGKTAENAIARTKDIISREYGQPRISTLHLRGESLGDNAIGTAYVIKEKDDELSVGSVTAQELIMGPNGIADLAMRYMIRQYVGQASDRQPKSGSLLLPEPRIRQDIDRHGSELATYVRVAKAMSKLTHLLGLTKPEWLADKIGELVYKDVLVLVALAENSSVSYQTPSYLPEHPNLALVTFKAVEGQKVGHLADEHVALGAITTAINIKRYKELRC